ncbi:TonB family protein [Cyclobacteriaceae bacterium YHN15]|nr:TonB family protein [Cyclobacteriaceae bacterium YHN15]
MAVLLDYIWQSTFCMLFFFGVHWVFLRNEKAFTVSRIYLLITPLLALLFPLISIPVNFDKPNISLEQTQFYRALSLQETPEDFVATFGLPEFTVQSSKLPLLWEIKDYLFMGYFLITLILSVRLLWSFLQLRMIKEKGWYQTSFNLKNNYFLIPTFGMAPIFSFFDNLFWDETQLLNQDEKEQILHHEIEHIRQKHSYDVVYYQILSIIFWFNPAIHLMRSALVDLHEYLADEFVLKKTINKENYPRLIVKMAFKGIDLPIGNYFIRSTTLKRIMMMKKSAKINWMKTLMVLPLSLMLLALVSMKTKQGISLFHQTATDNIEEIKSRLMASSDSLEVHMKVKRITNPVHYEFIGPLKNDQLKVQIGELQYEFGNIKSDEDYVRVRGLVRSLRNTSVIRKEYPQAFSKSEVTKIAEPEEGITAWNKRLIESLQKPEKELELGIVGMIEVEFLVDKNGVITDPVIKTSFGGGLDEQLLEALNKPEFKKWNPALNDGNPVNMVYSFSFGFSPEKAVAYSEAHTFFESSDKSATKSTLSFGDNEIFDVVENAPEYNGGFEAWANYLKENLSYPERAKSNKIEGVVYLVFVINKEGKVESPEILRGVGYGLDEEALRVVKESPDWIPGMQRGQKVNVRMRLPVRFKLPDEETNARTISGIVEKPSPETQTAEPSLRPTEEFQDFLRKNIKYPLLARVKENTGTVLAELTLNDKGIIKSITIRQSPSKELYTEVMETLEKNGEKWIVDGTKEEYHVELPIRFALAGKKESNPVRQKNEIVVVGYSSKKNDIQDRPITMNHEGSIEKKGTIIKSNLKDPLYIINGEVRPELSNDLLSIEPDQIETISVYRWAEDELKDKLGLYFKGDEDELKNQLAFFRNRAKNGVISITTKD